MHSGSHYTLKEVILWTRKDIYLHLILAAVATFLYQILGLKWIAIPWLPIAMMGTAVAFVVGFKNNATYDRMWEARRIWGSILNTSRSWGIMARDYVSNRNNHTKLSEDELKTIHYTLYNRHFAWLTALRYQLRTPRTWEAIYKPHNLEYKNKWFIVEEQNNSVEDALKPYLSEEEYALMMQKSNKAAQIISLQSKHLKELLEIGLIEDYRHMELEKLLSELYAQQGAAERIKNFPFPRQFSTLNLWFVKIFVLLIPFGMLQEFDKLGDNLIWLTIPFSALSAWIFTTMEKIGEASENPFEGSANDIPITAMSRSIEIDLREMLNENHGLAALQPENNILS
jgi:putative membrane protein